MSERRNTVWLVVAFAMVVISMVLWSESGPEVYQMLGCASFTLSWFFMCYRIHVLAHS